MDFQPLRYYYQSASSSDAPTLLLLHGTGGNERDLLPLAARFGNGYNILSLRGNVSEHGMPRFFKRLGMGVFDEKDVVFRTEEIYHFLNELAPKEGFQLDKLIALGYSNGANLAGAMLMLYPDFFAGSILFRPMQPLKNPPDTFHSAGGRSVFFSYGQQDFTVDAATSAQWAERLAKAGFQVETHALPTGHNLTQEDVDLAVKWMQSKF